MVVTKPFQEGGVNSRVSLKGTVPSLLGAVTEYRFTWRSKKL